MASATSFSKSILDKYSLTQVNYMFRLWSESDVTVLPWGALRSSSCLGNNYIFCWTVLFLLWHTKCQCHSYMLQWCFGEFLCTKLVKARQQIALFISLLLLLFFLNLSQSLRCSKSGVKRFMCHFGAKCSALSEIVPGKLFAQDFFYLFFPHTLSFSLPNMSITICGTCLEHWTFEPYLYSVGCRVWNTRRTTWPLFE